MGKSSRGYVGFSIVVLLLLAGCVTPDVETPPAVRAADFASCEALRSTGPLDCTENENLSTRPGRPIGWTCMATERPLAPERITIWREPRSGAVALAFEVPPDYPYGRGLITRGGNGFAFDVTSERFYVVVPNATDAGKIHITIYGAAAEASGALEGASLSLLWTADALELPPVYRLTAQHGPYYFLPSTFTTDGVTAIMPETVLAGSDFQLKLKYAERARILMSYNPIQEPGCNLRALDEPPAPSSLA